MSELRKAEVTIADGAHLDPFGRFRVSQPYSTFDSKQLHDNQPKYWDESQTGGTGGTFTHNAENARTVMQSTASTATRLVRQTRMVHLYQAGEGASIEMTGVLMPDAGGSGTERWIGPLSDECGFAFGELAGVVRVRKRKTVGTPVEQDFAQTSWNIDKMDGSGPSGETADWSKSQIFVFDFQWLGVGRIRFGLNIGGKTHYVHEINHANIQDSVSTNTPNLPLRYELSTEVTSPAISLHAICCDVKIEGGSDEFSPTIPFDRGVTGLTGVAADVETVSIAARLKSTHLDSVVRLLSLNVNSQTNDDFRIRLHYNPTYNGTLTFSPHPDCGLEFAVGTSVNDITADGDVIYTQYGKNTFNSSVILPMARRLGSLIDGTQEELIMSITPLGAASDILTGWVFRDLT